MTLTVVFGKKLALTLSTRDGNLDIYTLDLASQALTRITNDPAIDTEPQWSNDGRSLYFTSDRAGGPQIYRVGIQPGDKPRRLTFQNSYNARPRLSPDESQLARARETVMALLSPSPLPVDELVRQCQLSPAIVVTVLLELELAGRIERQPGNQVALL